MAFISGVKCDLCDELILKHGDGVYNKTWLTDIARKQGWSIGRKLIKCPTCRKKRKVND